MNQIVIRNLDDIIIQRIKQLAWQDGRPYEDMARRMLIEAVRARSARRPFADIESTD
jgi:plasmid stability protein